MRVPWRKRFWSKVEIIRDNPDDPHENSCWEWQGRVSRNGYGSFSKGGYPRGAHRLAWELAYNEVVPNGIEVCHTCDNPICVRPEHLFLGTRADNAADMVAKGRGVSPRLSGEANPAAKLTEEQVQRIRALYIFGQVTQRDVAEQFGISQQQVSNIISGKKWAREGT